MNLNAYWRLLRFDKPVGILLLWFPTAWALWLAHQAMPSWYLMSLFAVGTVLMRAAGCVVNDMADRNFDNKVQRTQYRPLTTGEVSLKAATGLLGLFLFIALIILLLLPPECIPWAFLAVGLTVLYPFCKRFLRAPQLVLGLAFSMGIPMAFVAQGVDINWTLILIFLINFLWIVAYDTMYAMVDREDDLKIGIKSTAIYFGRYDVLMIGLLQSTMHGLWFYLAYVFHFTPVFYLFWVLGLVVLVYQQMLIRSRKGSDCFKAFRVSIFYGVFMWFALIFC